jgi:hypothetical protein
MDWNPAVHSRQLDGMFRWLPRDIRKVFPTSPKHTRPKQRSLHTTNIFRRLSPQWRHNCTSTCLPNNIWHIDPYVIRKGEGKVRPRTGYQDGGGWSTPHSGRFTPGKDQVPFVSEVGWTQGPAWTGAENFLFTGIRSLDRPVRSDSLYRLSYPGTL